VLTAPEAGAELPEPGGDPPGALDLGATAMLPVLKRSAPALIALAFAWLLFRRRR
jgi:hypothetical protein